MTNELPPHQNFTQKSAHQRTVRFLSILVAVMVVMTASIPGVLAIMRRADAQVALGNAKSLRIALQVASTQAYAAGEPFHDRTAESGVTEEVWRAVLMDSMAPGDFWVLQTDESGYEVLRFLYQEGDFTVSYCKEPLSYEVYYQQRFIKTQSGTVY